MTRARCLYPAKKLSGKSRNPVLESFALPHRFSLIAVLAGAIALPALALAAEQDAVIVIGALHALHEREDSFGYDELDRLIRAARPDVMVLEVTPDELAGLKETRGRPEYPKVVWKLIGQGKARAVAMEPGEPVYGEITKAAGAVITAKDKADPETARFEADYRKAFQASMVAWWSSPADTQSAATAAMARSYNLVQDSLYGPENKRLQDRWDGHMADVAARTVRDNPGKRILVLGSYRNRHILHAAVSATAPERVVDTEAWMTSAR
jgi:hypothetical protein